MNAAICWLFEPHVRHFWAKWLESVAFQKIMQKYEKIIKMTQITNLKHDSAPHCLINGYCWPILEVRQWFLLLTWILEFFKLLSSQAISTHHLRAWMFSQFMHWTSNLSQVNPVGHWFICWLMIGPWTGNDVTTSPTLEYFQRYETYYSQLCQHR